MSNGEAEADNFLPALNKSEKGKKGLQNSMLHFM